MARRVALTDPQRAIKVIEEDGGVILTGFTSLADAAKVNADAAKFIKAAVEHRIAKGLPRTTTRVTRLFGRSETARETWLQQAPLLEILRWFLGTETSETSTDPILSVASTLDIPPGEKAQGLHRDDFIWQQTHSEQENYTRGRDSGLGVLVAGVKTTYENGATLFVPGSHLWEQSRKPQGEDVVAAELEVGEAFLFLASTRHAGGANNTESNRTVHGFFYCRSYFRPEENQFLWWKKAEVEKWSLAAQKQAGYVLDSPYIGHCDEGNPIDNFRADVNFDPAMEIVG